MDIFRQKTFVFTGKSETIELFPATYLFECWGAQGHVMGNNVGGKGSYTKGTISLKTKTTFYVFVGEYGKAPGDRYMFNGGGGGQYSGGGASDIRLINATWDNFDSLKSRIMVAAGGGGPDSGIEGGDGGCLIGLDAGYGKGGTQTDGGHGYVKGSFGKGGFYTRTDGYGCGGGGGGYYGGGSSTSPTDYSGGGGSSYISGYQGCKAIVKESTINNITHMSSSIHYSGLFFSYPEMIDGKTSMPSPTSYLFETGHTSDGYVRITILKSNECSCSCKSQSNLYMFILTVLLC
jgi:hypothetical protein